MLGMFKPMCGIFPWLLAVLCCQYDARAFCMHRPGGLSVRIQHPSLLPWKGSVCEALTWLAGRSTTQGVMVLLCYVAGSSSGRELCKSLGEGPAAMSQTPLLIPPHVPTA